MGVGERQKGVTRHELGAKIARSRMTALVCAFALALSACALAAAAFGLSWSTRALVASAVLSVLALAVVLARIPARERLEELSLRQQILLEAVTEGACSVDAQGRVLFASPGAARLLRLAPAEITGRQVHDLLHGAAPEEARCGEDCALKQALEGCEAAGEAVVFRADGTSFAAEYSILPIEDAGGPFCSVLSFRDVSQRSAVDRAKDEFISTVSHELRTPLTSIRGALGLLSSGIMGQLSDKGANLLRIALTNSDRLVRLINDILDLEKIQSGREPLAFQPVQLGEIVQQAIEGMQPVADGAGVLLAHDGVQVEIQADADRLLQVLTNLLSNAIKFSPAGSTVSVSLSNHIDGVVLSVTDQGRGIPEEKLEAIFGRFQQVDASDSREKGGSGLGLAICRTIVLQHSGRIWAERNPARGATIRVYLPARPDPIDEVAAWPDPGLPNTGT
jgi:PAS domain S-box-containing protein